MRRGCAGYLASESPRCNGSREENDAKQGFGHELKAALDVVYGLRRIACWCYKRYLHQRDREDGLEEIMHEISGRDAGPEFEITAGQFRDIATPSIGNAAHK